MGDDRSQPVQIKYSALRIQGDAKLARCSVSPWLVGSLQSCREVGRDQSEFLSVIGEKTAGRRGCAIRPTRRDATGGGRGVHKSTLPCRCCASLAVVRASAREEDDEVGQKTKAARARRVEQRDGQDGDELEVIGRDHG